MAMRWWRWAGVVVLAAAAVAVAAASPAGAAGGADVVLDCPRFRAVLGADAVWRSLTPKAAATDCLAADGRGSFAVAHVGGKDRPANRVSMSGGELVVGFAGCSTQLTYTVESRPDWIVLRLAAVAGERPDRLTLVRLAPAITQHVGPRLSCAWDEKLAVCLSAANMQTRGRADRRKGWAELTATTQDAPGPRLEGAAAAIVAVPTAELDGVLARLSTACELPRNCQGATPSKRLALARESYWFLSFSEKDVEKVIDCCRQTSIRQVMLMSGSWCRTVGHYTFQIARYPDGIESLRRTVAKLHEAGILVGMHCFASKVSKTDAYVTPVPDRRFWVDRSAELVADVGPDETTIRTRSDLSQWPGSGVAGQKLWEGGVQKHREVIVDDEIVRYEAIGPEGRWDTFLGCERGSWGTKRARHAGGTAGRHYGVDGCINGYIVDQETTLLEETTSRLAEIFNTCGFDMVYFDGGEDVDRRRFNYYVSKFQAAALAKFQKRPLVHMGTIMTHRLWHSFTRSGTVDTFLNTLHGRILAGEKVTDLPTVRGHVDRSVRYMLSIAEDRMPGELGWFGIWPKGKHTDGLQLDEIEYLMGKSLAHDAPISLETSFGQMAAHPLTPGILEIVRAYEELRRAGKVDEATGRRLSEPGRDFILLRRGADAPAELLDAAPAARVAGGPDVRAMLAQTAGDTVATVWHYLGREGRLVLRGCPRGTRVVDISGRAMQAAESEGGLAVALGPRRTTLILPGLSRKAAAKLLGEAAFSPAGTSP